jgi:uncharacterized protein
VSPPQVFLRPLANPLPLGFLARDVVAGTGMGILARDVAGGGPDPADRRAGLDERRARPLPADRRRRDARAASAAATGKLAALAVLGTTALRFAVTGLYELTASDTRKTLAGIVGLVLCALAVYTALAMALEDVLHRTLLPVGRRGGALGVGDEAGVREQL